MVKSLKDTYEDTFLFKYKKNKGLVDFTDLPSYLSFKEEYRKLLTVLSDFLYRINIDETDIESLSEKYMGQIPYLHGDPQKNLAENEAIIKQFASKDIREQLLILFIRQHLLDFKLEKNIRKLFWLAIILLVMMIIIFFKMR